MFSSGIFAVPNLTPRGIVVEEHTSDDFEHVVLETKTTARERADAEWLMRDVLSTPYAVVIRDGEQS